MPYGDIETFHEDGQWRNRVEGENRLLSTHGDKESAVNAGRDEARRREVEHIVKNLDGTIGEKNSYGRDPRNIPG
jgi:hypothetical protein